MKETVQNLKMEIRSNSENTNTGDSGNENLGRWTAITAASLDNSIQKKERENLRHCDTIGKLNSLLKENIKSKNFPTKTQRKSGTLSKE